MATDDRPMMAIPCAGTHSVHTQGGNMRKLFIIIGLLVAATGFAAPTGDCTQIDIAGAKSTSVFGINPRGDLAGQFTDVNNITHGFFIDRDGQISIIDVRGARRTTANGINSQGDIVGGYDDATGRHGYILSEGQFTTALQYPGSTFTVAAGINSRGDIVGSYRVGTA